jgi:hypothetical protein
MKHIKVRWKQSDPAAPVRVYSELDDAGWEQRKVEVFENGASGFASRSENVGPTFLVLEPVPTPAQILSSTQVRLLRTSLKRFGCALV